MLVLKTGYQVRVGEPAVIPADADTLDFLLHAKSRRVTVAGEDVPGLVISRNEANDQIVLVPSSKAKPGEYAVTLSAISESGEERQTNVNVVVQPMASVPNGTTRPPVVLLNGWQAGFTGTCSVATSSVGTFGNLASNLLSDGVPIVYLFDNCAEDANQPIEILGNDLGDFLKTIKFADGTQVPQIDLVGFSLGGLIARSYLAGLQKDQTFKPPVPTLVRKLVLIATPNFGSYVAGNYAAGLVAGSQNGELAPGSAFLWNLGTWNQHGDDLRGTDSIAVIGNAGTYTNLTTGASLAGGGDGLVSLTSASLGFAAQKLSTTRIVPYCHVDPSAFTNTVLGTFNCNGQGIARVTSASHLTGQIVLSFLGGKTDWASIGSDPTADQYLATNGASLFALQNTSGAYVTDLTQVTWGTVTLQNGLNSNTLFYSDFLKGTGLYKAVSSSLKTVSCGSLTASPGYTDTPRCKIGTAIGSITPLSTTAVGRAIASGGAVTLNGAFGTQCSNCKVSVTPAGSTTSQTLSVTSWSDKAIVVQVPLTLTGFMTFTVNAVPGNDTLGAMVVAGAAAGTIAVDQTALTYTYAAGGPLAATQSIAITNTGGGSLAWTATASDTWIQLSATSGTAPSTLSVMVGSMPAGTYSGTIQIASAGATNTPVTIHVSLVVTEGTAAVRVTPPSLSFAYTAAGAAPTAPDAQTILIDNSGAGTLTWTATSSAYWAVVSAASGTAPGKLSISVVPYNMPAGTYNASITIGGTDPAVTAVTVPVALVVTGTQAAPTITKVANAGGYQANFASGTWVAIFGSNLAEVPYSWQNSDFVNGALPTSLQGVSVSINGVPAYVSYIGPGQINVLAPDDSANGPVTVTVTKAQQVSQFTAQKAAVSPALFTFPVNAASDPIYAAARHLDYSPLAKPGLVNGATPAKAGETILLYGTGFGPTTPAAPPGQLLTTAFPLPEGSVQISIGGKPAQVTFAGLSQAGLYQFNVQVPDIPAGDAAVVATVGNISTQPGVLLTIQ